MIAEAQRIIALEKIGETRSTRVTNADAAASTKQSPTVVPSAGARVPMRILAQIHPPDTTRAILECLGLPIRPPPVADPKPEPGPPLDSLDDIETEEFDPFT